MTTTVSTQQPATWTEALVAPYQKPVLESKPASPVPTSEDAHNSQNSPCIDSARGSRPATPPAALDCRPPQTRSYEHLLMPETNRSSIDKVGRRGIIRRIETNLLRLDRPVAIKGLSEGEKHWKNIPTFHTEEESPLSRPKVEFVDSDEESSESSEGEDNESSESEDAESDAESDYQPSEDDQQQDESPHRDWVMTGDPWRYIARSEL